MNYKPGEIILVGFPFTSLSTTKKRPAVVISSQDYQSERPDVILLAITSQIREPLGFGECRIHDWQEAGLLKPSIFKPLITTIEQPQIIRSMGLLSDRDYQALQQLTASFLITSI